MELKSKLYLIDEQGDKFMGIGVLWLLEEIARQSSLRKAALVLGISYSKAYGMIENLEKGLDMKMLERKRGGSSREGATLTKAAERFIAVYRTFHLEAKERLVEPYERFVEAMKSVAEEDDECKEL
ncbi:MAG: LysR family transcriptional regulator [Spirochaetales bacterium]|nr:LysR family transcriptional regulator [Spirochaetales bacterium]